VGRLDAVLAAAFPALSRARLQRLIAAGHVRVNGSVARKSGQVAPGDRLSVEVPPTAHPPTAVDFELPVLFEDDALVAVDKPPGLAVHGAPGETGPSVALWFLAEYPGLASAFDAERPGIVHRLDKDTSGVLLLAKTPAAQAALSQAFEGRLARKTYLAVCQGAPPRTHAVVDAPIARHPVDRLRMAIAKHGRAARTEYEVLFGDGRLSLLLVHPESGRTHQVRVHLAAVGAPVLNDGVYGKGGAGGRQFLHAWRLSVPHPSGGWLTVTAALPPDMAAAVRALAPPELALTYTSRVAAQRTEESP
jgi:23S rRNA pseudouridine1911/1915/1917 synthase